MPEQAGALPTFVIIGAMKAGTSSLHYYLGRHPDVSMSTPKELKFFVANADAEAEHPERHFELGLDWYRSHFDAGAKARGESSPQYLDPGHPGVAARMAAIIPGAKLIVMTREPFDRAVSHYEQNVANGREQRSMSEALSEESSHYRLLSSYHRCLEPFYEHFEPGQIIRFRLEDLEGRQTDLLSAVFALIGVDPSIELDGLDLRINTVEGRGLLHRVMDIGRGSRLRSAVGMVVPVRLKYELDARSRSTKAPVQARSVDPALREAFELSIASDAEALERDLAEGRLVEGLAPVEPEIS